MDNKEIEVIKQRISRLERLHGIEDGKVGIPSERVKSDIPNSRIYLSEAKQIISSLIKPGGNEKVYLWQIIDLIKIQTGASILTIVLKTALGELGFKLQSLRNGGSPFKGYRITIDIDPKMQKFIDAKKKGMVVNGIDIKDYFTPDAFNEAVKNNLGNE